MINFNDLLILLKTESTVSYMESLKPTISSEKAVGVYFCTKEGKTAAVFVFSFLSKIMKAGELARLDNEQMTKKERIQFH